MKIKSQIKHKESKRFIFRFRISKVLMTSKYIPNDVPMTEIKVYDPFLDNHLSVTISSQSINLSQTVKRTDLLI